MVTLSLNKSILISKSVNEINCVSYVFGNLDPYWLNLADSLCCLLWISSFLQFFSFVHFHNYEFLEVYALSYVQIVLQHLRILFRIFRKDIFNTSIDYSST